MSGRTAGIIITIAGAVLGIFLVIVFNMHFEDIRMFFILNMIVPAPWNFFIDLMFLMMIFAPIQVFNIPIDILFYVAFGVCVFGAIIAGVD